MLKTRLGKIIGTTVQHNIVFIRISLNEFAFGHLIHFVLSFYSSTPTHLFEHHEESECNKTCASQHGLSFVRHTFASSNRSEIACSKDQRQPRPCLQKAV